MKILLAVAITLATATGGLAAEFFDCMIEPYTTVEFSSQVPGIMDQIMVERGDIIKKGQVLAKLKSGVEEAVVAQARTQLEFLKRKDERNKELSKKNLISAYEKDEIETELLRTEQLLKEAEEKLKLRTIVSTIDGVVTERSLYAGEYAGENTPVLKAAAIDPLNVEVVVPVRLYGTIKKGMKAEVRPEIPVEGVYRGKVVIVDKVVDAASGTFGVRVEVGNKDLRLPAGLKGRVRFVKN